MSNDRLPAARLRLGLTQQQVADTVARVLEEPVDAKYVGRLEPRHVAPSKGVQRVRAKIPTGTTHLRPQARTDVDDR